MTPDQFYRLEMLVIFALDRFGKALDRLEASHFPSSVPRQFLLQLRSDIAAQSVEFKQILDDVAADPEGAFDRLCSEHRKLLARLMYLQAVENAKTEDVPWSLIPSIERMARTLLPDRDILTTALAEFNYQIAFTDVTDGIHKYLILFLPRLHRANAFLHILIGHELFHPLLEPFLLEESKSVLPALRNGCLSLLIKAGEVDNLFTRRRVDEIVELARHYWYRALEEVMCDFGCVSIFGPAAVLSMSTYALTGELDERPSPEGDYYPPMRYRLRSIVRQALGSEHCTTQLAELFKSLTASGLTEDARRLEERLATIRSLTETTTDLNEIRSNPVVDLAYRSVESSLLKAWQYVCDVSEKLSEQQWTHRVADIPILLRSLSLLVPPSEIREEKTRIGTPATWSSIAIACWIFQLRSEVPLNSDERLVSFKRVCRLMLKACEDSELKREFASWQIEGA